jgi:hypothetical protein
MTDLKTLKTMKGMEIFKKTIPSCTLSKYLIIFCEYKVPYVLPRLKRLLKLNSNGPKHTVTKYRLFLMYGKEEGLRRWAQYCTKQAITNTKEYKNMSDEEFKKYNDARASTKDNFIERYGEVEGNKKWESYCNRQSYTKSKQYYIDNFGEYEGAKKFLELNKSKSNCLEIFIKRYGEIEGNRKWQEYNDKRHIYASPISQKLFKNIDDKINIKSYFSSKNKEFCKYNKALSKPVFFDYVIPGLKLCIEYNGDIFHANPKLFKADDCPNPWFKNLTAKEIWKNDFLKQQVLIQEGYSIITVWDSEYRDDPEQVERNIISLIKRRQNEHNKHR